MRKSARVLMPSAACSHTDAPWPPSPPSGPPKGMNFSRRKLTQPRPPWPACTFRSASSTNFTAPLARSYGAAAGRRGGSGRRRGTGRAGGDLMRLAGGLDAHVQMLLGAAVAELHPAANARIQRVVGTDADVRAGAYARAALTHDDVA